MNDADDVPSSESHTFWVLEHTGRVQRTDDVWVAALDSRTARDTNLTAALVSVVGGRDQLPDGTIVGVDCVLDWDTIVASVTQGLTLCDQSAVLYTLREGDIAEESPDEHPDYVEVGTIHGNPANGLGDEEVDLYDNDFLFGDFGRIGNHYFEKRQDEYPPWLYYGRVESDERAAEMAAGGDFIVRMCDRRTET